MGANIEVKNQTLIWNGVESADSIVNPSSCMVLRCLKIIIPNIIDEIPILSIAAAFAEGTTINQKRFRFEGKGVQIG